MLACSSELPATKGRALGRGVLAGMVSTLLGMSLAIAAEPSLGILGKNDWLYYRYEMTVASDLAATDASLDLIQRLNKVLAANGTRLVVAEVPLKMRIYAEHLPDDIKINDFMAGNYERMRQKLQAAKVNVVDLNTAFLNNPLRVSDTPLYFRLDTHWTPTGAMLAAETIKAGVAESPALQGALDATPVEGFKMVVANRKRPSASRDLVPQLPQDSQAFETEQVARISVSRTQPPKQDLLGNAPVPGVTLVGSSYSRDWTGFPDALRYVFQRDLLSVAVGADQGSWVGMETYLRDDAFQTQAPKLLIWEMPERDMRAPPDYKYREARYISDNTEWLLRAAALVQSSCKPSSSSAKLATVGLAANAGNVKGADLAVGSTSESDFVELVFDKPLEKLDYISARATSIGSKAITLETSAAGVALRRFAVPMPGDDAAHALKTPLPSTGAGYTSVRVYPGKSNGFALQAVQVCRLPEELLR